MSGKTTTDKIKDVAEDIKDKAEDGWEKTKDACETAGWSEGTEVFIKPYV
jgi:hypothetical protein